MSTAEEIEAGKARCAEIRQSEIEGLLRRFPITCRQVGEKWMSQFEIGGVAFCLTRPTRDEAIIASAEDYQIQINA